MRRMLLAEAFSMEALMFSVSQTKREVIETAVKISTNDIYREAHTDTLFIAHKFKGPIKT